MLRLLDPLYGPMIVFVKTKNNERATICRVYEENGRFLTDESITVTELAKLEEAAKEYLEEIVEMAEEVEDHFEKFLEKNQKVKQGQTLPEESSMFA